MSIETDLLVDRGRLKRRLAVWRIVAILAVLAAVLAGAGRASQGVIARDYVARVTVAGVIADDRKRVEEIRALADDKRVKAVVLVIDSPGGTVSGGQALYGAFAAISAKKPMVAVMDGVAASAGYMIAMPSQRVFARAGTLTGSIGVILQTAEVSGLLGRVGVSAEAITSGPLKDQPSFTKPLSTEGRDVLHGLVMDLYDQFVGVVATGRHMTVDQVKQLADGRAYSGRQALALGLVDEIGGEPEARTWLATKGVATSLPARDTRKTGLGERLFEERLGGWLGSVAAAAGETVLRQGLSGRENVDGAWAIWHPSATAE